MLRFDLGAALLACVVALPVSAQQQPAMVPLGDTAPAQGGWGVNCAVRPLQVVEVAAPVNGIIAKVHVKPGQKVKAGDVLVNFDTVIAETDLAMATARAKDTSGVDMAERRLAGLNTRVDRLAKARESRAIPEADYDAAVLERDLAAGELASAKANLEFARIEADRARQAVEKATVTSPVNGTVAEGLIDPGESPDADQPIATITVTDPLRIEAYVPTSQVAAFVARPEHKAQIGPQIYDVTLDYVSAVADLSSGTLSVFFTLHADSVLPGLDCVIPVNAAAIGE